jgi:hypothetical protein
MFKKFRDANFYKYVKKGAKCGFFARKGGKISITKVWFL